MPSVDLSQLRHKIGDCQSVGSGITSAKDNPVRLIGVHLEASLKPLCNASPEVLR